MSKERSTEDRQDTTVPDGTEGPRPAPAAGEATTEPPGEAETSALQGLQARVRQLEEESASLKDQLLRALADSENFRKRMYREREEAVRYANASLLSDLITVIDDFERAIESAAVSKDFESLRSGVGMIERQLVSMLERNWGLKRFQSAGEEFDPEKHQAIMVEQVPVAGQTRPVVLEDYQKGYRLHDRILRPAKVKVSQPAAPQSPDAADTDAPGGADDRSDPDNDA